MITEQEWLKANVYAAPVVNARLGKLNAICKLRGEGATAGAAMNENKLIHVEGLSDAGVVEGAAAQG